MNTAMKLALNAPLNAPTNTAANTGPGFSRRRLLGMGLGSLGALAATQVIGSGPASAATFSKPKPKPQAISATDPRVGPFAVRASCDLTEDYFLTSPVATGSSRSSTHTTTTTSRRWCSRPTRGR
jgi:hypothetical protein